jgi:hypothetical protein
MNGRKLAGTKTALTSAVECGDQSGVGLEKVVPASRFELLTPRV